MKEQQIYTGVIRTIGAGTAGSSAHTTETRASVLEIEDEVLERVAYDSYMETYLSRAVESGKVVSIALAAYGSVAGVSGWKNVHQQVFA